MNYFRQILLFLIITSCMAAGGEEVWAYSAPQQKSATKGRQRARKSTPASTSKTTNAQKGKPAGKTKTATPKSTTRKSGAGKPETSADVKKRQEATQKEIKLTEQQIKENERSVRAGLSELGKLESEMAVSRKKIKESSDLISDLNSQISDLEDGIQSNERELEKMRDQYLQAIRKMRGTSRNRSALAFVFSSESFHQAYRRMRYLRQFAEWKERQSEMIAGKTEELNSQKEGLAQARKEQDDALRRQQSEENSLKERHERQNSVVADLKRNGQALKSHLSKKQAEANELRGRIAELIAQEERKAAEARKAEEEKARKAAEEKSRKEAEEKARKEAADREKRNAKDKQKGEEKENLAKAKETEVKNPEVKNKAKEQVEVKAPAKEQPRKATISLGNATGENFASMKGKLPRPASGEFRVTSRFGRQSLPELPDVVYDNPGIDAEVGAGSSALAVFGGKVSGVYMLPGYHTVVIVNHGLYYTVYGNISVPGVKVGDEVRAGQNLGLLAPDEDDRSHSSIHFELWKGREKLNPQDWIR